MSLIMSKDHTPRLLTQSLRSVCHFGLCVLLQFALLWLTCRPASATYMCCAVYKSDQSRLLV